jgi:hypothetical protein
MSNLSSFYSLYLVSSTIYDVLIGAVRREKYGSQKNNSIVSGLGELLKKEGKMISAISS